MSMTAEIISVGTELLLGNILNTNAQYLSRELAALGITVRRQSTIGDNHGRLADFVNEAKQRCDLLVFTGGLGPTADDLTKETVAACFGDTLTFDPDEWQKIVDFFTRTGRETTPNNRKQAMVPVHGHKVVNHHGTAPGAWFEQDGHCAVLMPGVPHEMKAMWEESVRPLLLARQSCALHSLTLRVLGGESNLEYRVRALLENPNPTAAIYCKTGECEIRITARAQNDAEAQTMCRAYAKKFYDLLGDAVYDEDVAGLEETVVHTLRANGLTIATAESCTGGMIAQRLTSVSGASEVFGYGFVTYWEQAKAKLVGVDPAVIEQYNVVSAPVWLVGHFSLVLRGNYELVYLVVPLIAIAWIYAKWFNIVGMGRDFSKNLGVNYTFVLFSGLSIAAMITASIVTVVGSISYIGLIVPNLVAIFKGDDLRSTLADTALFGALFVLCCDLIGRLIILPYELPIELIIGTLGSLIFIVLIFYRLRFGRRSLNKDLLMKLFGLEKKTPVCTCTNGGVR